MFNLGSSKSLLLCLWLWVEYELGGQAYRLMINRER